MNKETLIYDESGFSMGSSVETKKYVQKIPKKWEKINLLFVGFVLAIISSGLGFYFNKIGFPIAFLPFYILVFFYEIRILNKSYNYYSSVLNKCSVSKDFKELDILEPWEQGLLLVKSSKCLIALRTSTDMDNIMAALRWKRIKPEEVLDPIVQKHLNTNWMEYIKDSKNKTLN